jgi:hypothetical protein
MATKVRRSSFLRLKKAAISNRVMISAKQLHDAASLVCHAMTVHVAPFPVDSTCSPHSHSIVLSHGNALIFQRKFFLRTAKTHFPIRQKFALLNSKENFSDSEIPRFQLLSTRIGRFFPLARRYRTRRPP